MADDHRPEKMIQMAQLIEEWLIAVWPTASLDNDHRDWHAQGWDFRIVEDGREHLLKLNLRVTREASLRDFGEILADAEWLFVLRSSGCACIQLTGDTLVVEPCALDEPPREGSG